MEPFRWLGDVTTIEAFESGVLDLKDFYFTGDDYRYRIEIEVKRRFLQLLKERFNSGISCKGRVLKWDTVIEQKANELGRFLVEKSSALEFDDPAPRLERHDDREMRAKILAVTFSQAKQLNIGKSTLHYLRKKARNAKQFSVYTSVRSRLG